MEENEQQLNDQLNGIEPEETKAEEEEQVEEKVDEQVEETEEEKTEETEHEEKQLTAAEKRFQKLANERAEEKAKRESAEREKEFYRLQLEQIQRAQQKPAEEELDPDEKWRRDANATIQRVQLQTQDLADRSAFMSKYAGDSEIAAMHAEIEAKLTELRNHGHNPPRENVLTFLLGQKALEKRASIPKIKKEAAERVKAAQSKPLGTKSNVAATKSESTEYERLKDIPL